MKYFKLFILCLALVLCGSAGAMRRHVENYESGLQKWDSEADRLRELNILQQIESREQEKTLTTRLLRLASSVTSPQSRQIAALTLLALIPVVIEYTRAN